MTWQVDTSGAAAVETNGGAGEAKIASPGATLRERFAALKDIGPYLAMVWSASPALMASALSLRLVRALLPIAILYIGKLIIDDVVALAQMPERPYTFQAWLDSGRLNWLMMLLGLEFTLAVLADMLGRVVSLVDGLLAERVTNYSTRRLMQHAATLDLADFEDADFQDQLDRARHQTGGSMILTTQLFDQAQDIVTVLSFGMGLVFYAPVMVAVLIISLLPAFLGEAHFNARGYELDYQLTPERREMDHVRQTASSVETAKEIKIFGLSHFLITRYMELAHRFYSAYRRLALRRASWGSLFSAVGTVGSYAAYAYIIWRTLTGDFTIGDLTFLAASFQRLRLLLENLLASFSSTAGQALYLKDLFSFFEVQPGIKRAKHPRAFPQPVREGFSFENVGFKYPGTNRWAMRHLSFKLKAGEVLALVGENGAGKTTLVKLMARLYDPTEGRILLDGHDLRDYDLDQLRDNIGVIFQDFVRYNLTAADNIAVGKISHRFDRAAIEQAAERSQADQVIARLPRGYRQMVGKRFRDGVDLSGGEWQKMAIARAYVRDAEVLVLDEPTAALDARAEYEVFRRFKELSEGKTAILISHRFSSVRMADRILVLAEGQVAEDGSHDQLMKQGGHYAELFDLQAAGYR